MKIALITIGIAGFFVVLVWILLKQKKANATEKRRKNLPVDYPESFPHVYREAGFPLIQSVTEVPEHARKTIRDAIINEMNVARLPEYFPHWARPAIESIVVSFIESGGNGEDGLPDILIDGKRTAGTVIGVNAYEWHRLEIILPTFQENNWTEVNYLMDGVFNECEHLDEFLNDQSVYARYTGWNDSHKHRTVPEGFVLLQPTYPAAGRGLLMRAPYRANEYASRFNCGLEAKK